MKIIWIILLVLSACTAYAQKERKFVREGNTLFDQQDFEKAEVEYRKALDKKESSYAGAFNLGDALYKQKKYEEALQQFSALAKKENDKERLGELYHNIGNTLLAMEKTDESIEAYKESLRNRPASEETKYNLEYARMKKQQQEQQNKDQDQNKDQNKDQQEQNQDQQNQDQNKDQQNQDKQDRQDQNKDQQDPNQDKQEQNQEQQQPQQAPKISKEDAKRLLEALQNDEKRVQEKVQKEKAEQQKARRLKIEKDW